MLQAFQQFLAYSLTFNIFVHFAMRKKMFPCNELDLLLCRLALRLTRADKEAFSALTPSSPAPAQVLSSESGWGDMG